MKNTNTQIKICLFSGDITRGGGTERVACFLANELNKNPQFDVSIVSLTEENNSPCFLLSSTIPRYTLSLKWVTPGLGYLPVFIKFIKLVKKKEFSIIIDIDTVLDILSVPCKWITKAKLISWEHFQFDELLDTSYRKWCRWLSCNFSDHIVTLTRRDASVWKEKGKPKCPVTTISNPADALPPYKDELPREKIILSVGRLVPIKGFIDIIPIARKISPRFPDWKFFIVGDGEDHEILETMIHKYGLEDSVVLIPFTNDISTFYLRASVCLLTSRSEGLSMVLLEAKYYRLPSISYDIMNGPADIIIDGINGYLVPPKRPDLMAEKLALLLKDAELRQTFSEHAWDNIDLFSKKTIVQKWTDLLLQINAP